MTLNEVIQELRANTKCYIGVMPQSTFSETLRNIETGRAKDITVTRFLAQFGYTIEKERTWKKQ